MFSEASSPFLDLRGKPSSCSRDGDQVYLRSSSIGNGKPSSSLGASVLANERASWTLGAFLLASGD